MTTYVHADGTPFRPMFYASSGPDEAPEDACAYCGAGYDAHPEPDYRCPYAELPPGAVRVELPLYRGRETEAIPCDALTLDAGAWRSCRADAVLRVRRAGDDLARLNLCRAHSLRAGSLAVNLQTLTACGCTGPDGWHCPGEDAQHWAEQDEPDATCGYCGERPSDSA